MTVARKKFKLEGNVSNHTVRKTCIGRLLDAEIPENYVAQQVGMKNLDSLKSYKTPGAKHKLQISNVLDNRPSTPVASSGNKQMVSSSTITKPESSTMAMGNNILQPSKFVNPPAQVQSSSSSAPSFSNLSGCTFNFNCGNVGGLLPQNNKPAEKTSPCY